MGGMAYVNIQKLDVLEKVEEGYYLSSDNLLKLMKAIFYISLKALTF